MGAKRNKSISWVLVIILLIFVPLIGIILLIKKLFEDKAGAYQNSLVARILAGVWLGFGAFMFLLLFPEAIDKDSIFMLTVMFLIPGFLLFLKGVSLKRAGVRYEKYLQLIWQQQIHSIDDLASEVSLTYAKTSKELEALINSGYIVNAYVDHGRQMVIVDDYVSSRPIQPVISNTSAVNKSKQNISKVVTCKNCGASNSVISGTVAECEYCGTPIS